MAFDRNVRRPAPGRLQRDETSNAAPPIAAHPPFAHDHGRIPALGMVRRVHVALSPEVLKAIDTRNSLSFLIMPLTPL
jgi:hypothetical protein